MLIYVISVVGLVMVAFFVGYENGYEKGKTAGVEEQIRLCEAGKHG